MGLSEDVRTQLIAGGMVANSLFVAESPEKPDTALAITATGGLGPLRTMSGAKGNAPLERVRIQLRARAVNYAACDALMTQAYGLLSGLGETVIGTWRYYFFTPVQTPYYLGLDGAARPVIAVNFDVQRKEDTN